MALVDERKVNVLVHICEHGPIAGYAIATSDDDDTAYSKGYIYDVLGELEDEGMIEVAERESEGRNRVQCQLTENGRLLLQALDEIEG
jgi:Transcriptional regulator PadR-like family.